MVPRGEPCGPGELEPADLVAPSRASRDDVEAHRHSGSHRIGTTLGLRPWVGLRPLALGRPIGPGAGVSCSKPGALVTGDAAAWVPGVRRGLCHPNSSILVRTALVRAWGSWSGHQPAAAAHCMSNGLVGKVVVTEHPWAQR